MAFPRLGKLPPLQAIGRAAHVDLDEPPDFGDESDVDNLIEEYENYERGYYYVPEHAGAAADALGQLFKVLQPGNHICKCTKKGETGFAHCRKAVAFGQRFQELKRNLENRAKLEFMKAYITHIQQMSILVNNLQAMVQTEYQTWRAICKSHLQSPPSTNLESLYAICEELRVHLIHWNSLKQMVLMDKWLRPVLPHMTAELMQIRDEIFMVRNSALWWTDKLITIGLRVLAHCDPSQLNQDTLWSVTRGIEEFNSIINTVKADNSSLHSNRIQNGTNCHSLYQNRTFSSAVHINSYKNLLEGLKPVPFSRVLNVLAHERSKYAAVMTHNFFTASEDLLLMLRACNLPEYIWSEHKGNNKTRPSSAIESSDYYTQTGSNVSLGSALLRVGSVVAPDLSKQDSAVSEFATREREFAQKFLQIVNRSTKLLKRPQDSVNPVVAAARPGSARAGGSNTPPQTVRKGVGFSSVSAEDFSKSQVTSIFVASATNMDDDNISLCSLSSTLGLRKSVSWGDASEMGILRQLSEKYMEMLWQNYEQEMLGLFLGHVVGGMAAGRMQLGNVMLCSDIVTIVISTMINQTCMKDIFPSGAVKPLQSLAKKLQVMAAWRAWDQEYSSALGSQLSDRCSATPLAEGEYSTKTAHRLREAYQPLHSVIAALQMQAAMSDKEKLSILQLVAPTLQRFILTSEVSLKWCVTKCDQFLANWSVAQFLLVTQSDLKILSDEVRHVLYTSQPLCSSSKKNSRLATTHLSQQLSDLYQKLNDISAQLQTLSGSSVKRLSACCRARSMEFFEETMPQGKYWRRKMSGHNIPTSRSEYIEQGLQELLQPVVHGISELRTTSQISAVSVAVTSVCEAWTRHILKHKIRFSYLGACQLELDFIYVQDWLSSHLQNNESVHQSILSLDIFKYLTKAAQLLKQQPGAAGSRPSSNYSRSTVSCSKSDTGIETTDVSSIPQELTFSNGRSGNSHSRSHPFSNGVGNGSNEEMSSQKHQLKSASQVLGNDGVNDEEVSYRMDNKEQWLALRVHGGSRHWPKLPNCFPSSS